MELGTKSVRIRPLQPDDSKKIAELANNRKIWLNVRDMFPHPFGESDAMKFIESKRLESPQTTFGITYNRDLTGAIGLVLQEDVYRYSAELGYWIGEPFWNNGIATNALRLMITYAFEKLQLKRLFAGVFEGNEASKKVLEKCGFEFEGIAQKAVFKNGLFLDEYRYVLLKR